MQFYFISFTVSGTRSWFFEQIILNWHARDLNNHPTIILAEEMKLGIFRSYRVILKITRLTPEEEKLLNWLTGGSVNSTTFPLPGASGGPFLLFWEVRQFNYFSSWGDSFWGSANCSSWRTLSSKANFPLGPFWSIFLTPFFLFNGHVLLFCSLFFIVKEPISSCMFVYCSTVPVIPCMLRPSQEWATV